ncbi:MAG: peptide chain release factor N(5)-glutamine methyltransferase [Desulfuromonadales bacterium]|nr:peptide chain release factor N(5)-glutamine methyltransferase [Desulfuromonadales bacterium]
MSESWTLLKLLRWMSGYFSDKGIDNPRLDAELLLAHQLGLDRVGLYLNYDRPLTTSELGAIRPLVKRRGQREPLQYLLGSTEFWSLSLKVTPAVLVPRADTEVLVEEALKRCAAKGAMLDVGTGSGAILISLLKELPGWQGVGMDISPAALDIARHNLTAHALEKRGQLLVGDLATLPERRFDLIVSNPPYIPTAQWDELMPEVRDYEPALALLGGVDGLDCYRRLTAQAQACLNPGAWLVVEIGADQGDVVTALFAAAGLTELFLRHDYGGHPRVVGGQRNG